MKFIMKKRKALLKVIDISIIMFAYCIAAMIIAKEFKVTEEVLKNAVLAIFIYGGLLQICKTYKNITRYENGNDYLKYVLICFSSCIIMTILNIIINSRITMTRLTIVASLIIAVGIIGYRVLLRMLLTIILPSVKSSESIVKNNLSRKNVLVIGAGDAARTLILTIRSTLNNNYNIVGLIDDDITKIGYLLAGNKICGTRDDIPKICKEKNVELILFSISNITNKDRKQILEICYQTGCKVRILPGTKELIKNKSIIENFRDVEIEDLLGREQINLDNKDICKLIENNTVLVTRSVVVL